MSGLPNGTIFKSTHFEVKSFDEDQGIARGYLSRFGNVDEQYDVVVKGAFKKTINDAFTRKTNGRKFLWPLLWMHDPEQPIGLIIDAGEDDYGLLITAQLDITTNKAGIPNNAIATRVFSGFKMGYNDELSIGYRPIQHELVKLDGSTVRKLTEICLVEGSAVTSLFAANDEAVITGVKSLDAKATVCGDTGGPIGPRDESWDGGAASKQIWAVAAKADGTLNATLCRKYFMVLDGDPQNKTSWGYPFWYVGNSPHICVGAVKAIAAAAQGARGASAPDGIKSKVETLYSRINKKYPNDPELTPPWKMLVNTQQQKTFESRYAEEMCEDLLDDWCDVLLCSFTSAMLDAFRIGDEPQSDMQAALTAFGQEVNNWVAQAIRYNLTTYLVSNDSGEDDDSTPYTPPTGDTTYSTMARIRDLLHKQGARISAATRSAINDHIDTLHDQASTMQKATRTHVTAIRNVADDLATILQGSEGAYGTDPGTPAEGQGPAKARRRPDDDPPARDENAQPDLTTEIASALSRLQGIKVV